MNIGVNAKASQPNFGAKLKDNELVKDLLNHTSKEDKEEFDKAVRKFATVATDDVVELRKTNEKNTEVYSLVNTKNEKQKVFVCRMFPNAVCEDDGHEEYRREHSRLEYVRDALVDTLKEASNKYSEAFSKLFAQKSQNSTPRLSKYYV